mgnify:CR=1 FL=1
MERPSKTESVGLAPDMAQLLVDLQALLGQVSALAQPRGSDLVGHELQVMERSLRRLLRELGVLDTVDTTE